MLKEVRDNLGNVTYVEMTEEEIRIHNETVARVTAEMAANAPGKSEIELLKERIAALEARLN